MDNDSTNKVDNQKLFKLIKKADINNDGFISLNEFQLFCENEVMYIYAFLWLYFNCL